LSKQVTHDGRGSLEIRFGFDRRLVDLVKTLPDRRWNPTDKYWSVPEAAVVSLVELLQPEGFGFDDATVEIYRGIGGTVVLQAVQAATEVTPQASLFGDDSGAPDDYSVARLNAEVKGVLEEAFPAPIWIVGEISSFNKSAHKRHVTFHLLDRDDSGKTRAEVNATLFERTRREIRSKLAAAGNPFELEDEITVRVRGRVELYVAWGLYRVVVEDLDINYTLGEAARRREEIVRRLTDAGLIDLNTSLPFPELPLRVGLITSLHSDAYNDVLRSLQESGYAFDVTAHGARVQGHSTEPSVLNALDWFRQRAEAFDVVLICRGGGSRTDLAWFDSEALGRAVAEFPLPVVVGIGHEQDFSVLDSVGWRQKTPTAASGFLVERVGESLFKIEERGKAIIELAGLHLREQRHVGAERARRLALAARNLLDRARTDLTHRSRAVPRAALVHVGRHRALLSHAAQQVAQGARHDLAVARSRVAQIGAALHPGACRRLALETERIVARARRLHLVDPQRVVERGYSILRTGTGAVVDDARTAPAGTLLNAQLKCGRLTLRSEGPVTPPGE
jgi:exodeoxyribonuclease VII large subunit